MPSRLSIALRLHLITVIALVSMLCLAGITAWDGINRQERERVATLRGIVDSSIAIAAHFEKEAEAGHLSQAEAKAAANTALRALRYDGDNYVFVEDLQPKMVMHPFRPDLEGKSVADVRDPTGLPVFAALADIVRAQGSGTLSYLWPRPGSADPVEKLTFVQGFAPWGWAIGTGVYVDDLRAQQRALLVKGGVVALALALLVGLAAWWMARGLVRPLLALTRATDGIAHGELATAIPGAARGDELGVLARALETLREGAIEKRAMERKAEAERALKDRRQTAMERHTDEFARSISGVMGGLTEAAGSVRSIADEVASGAVGTSAAMEESIAGAGEAADSLAMVAAATEELSASVAEISRQVAQASAATDEAVARSQGTSTSIAGLSHAARQITDVVRLISEIAARTNLLALNATIEAARAGEAGRGFAVVASEVKQLAQQTARATEEIDQQVRTIQAATAQAVEAVEAVGEAVGGVNTISVAIATAVEQQGAATAEIARQVASVAQQNTAAMQRLGGVGEVAKSTRDSGTAAQAAATRMAEISDSLRQEVDLFLSAMRSDTSDRRAYERIPVAGRSVTLRVEGQGEMRVPVVDVSRGGIGLVVTLAPAIAIGHPVTVAFGDGEATGRIAWRSAEGIGVVFRGDPRSMAGVDRYLSEVQAALAQAA